MKRYIGIIKVETDSNMGITYKIKTKFSNDLKYLDKWVKLYPDSEHMILDNTETLQNFFEVFEDLSPVLAHEGIIARKLYEEFVKED